MLLVGDIGGTWAKLALVAPGGDGATVPAAEAALATKDYSTLEELVRAFLRPMRAAVERAVFAVAGPVVRGSATLTNLGWVLDEARLREALGISSVALINDLVAKAYAVPHLGPKSLHTLQRGVVDPGGSIAVVAPGTGLGESFLTWDGDRYRAHASEAGHSDFAPVDDLQVELLRWLSRDLDHVSFERVCSGRGVPNLYRFLEDRGGAPRSSRTAAQLQTAEDPTPVIFAAGLDERDPCALSVATVQLFAAILAAEAGNAALRVLATGGVYLAGGLPRRLLPILSRPEFLERFQRKGRLKPVLSRIPLHVVTRANVGLLGARHYAVQGHS
ncbi:MAG TPA: glucokinase [Gemmatimonadales bacterium]|nr:glucokinase [Gemmatimonadales bacterium]